MKSAGKYDEQKPKSPNSKQVIRWYRRRYRERIWFIAPEGWMAISFSLLVLGMSLLNAYFCVPDGSEHDRETVFRLGGILLFIGWAVFVFLIESIRIRVLQQRRRQLLFREHNPPFVGVSIPPPSQQEWLSVMLLPEIEREYISTDVAPGAKPYQYETDASGPLPVPESTEKDNEDCKLSISKKKRNRKKKNNQVSGQDQPEQLHQTSDPPVQSNQTSSQADLLNQTLGQPVQPCQTSGQPVQSNQTSSGDQPGVSYQVSNEDEELPTSTKGNSNTKNKQTSVGVATQESNNAFVDDNKGESNKISGQTKGTNQTSRCDKPEESNLTIGGDIPELSHQTSGRDKVDESHHTTDQSKKSNITCAERHPGNSKQISQLDSKLSTSKKKNRKRK